MKESIAMNKYVIYCAIDPITNEIRYIGQTTKGLKHREKRHKKEALHLEDHTHRWMRLLLKKNLWPIFQELEVFEYSENVQKILDEVEVDYIRRFRAENFPLTNTAPGGRGVGSGPEHPFFGKHHTNEAIEKIREASKNQVWTEERKKKISDALKGEKNPWFGKSSPAKGRKHSEETKALISQKQTGNKRPERSGDKHWMRRTGIDPFVGKRATPESISKMKEKLTGKKYPARNGKSVVCVEDGRIFRSQQLAADEYGLTKLQISRSCKYNKSVAGLTFKFMEKP